MLASNTCMVVQESNETLSSSNCTALINSLVLPITYGKGERGGSGKDKGRDGRRRGWEERERKGKRREETEMER